MFARLRARIRAKVRAYLVALLGFDNAYKPANVSRVEGEGGPMKRGDVVTTRRCPRDGQKLTVTIDDETERTMLRCSQPCSYEEPLPEDIRLRLAGAPMLEGFQGLDAQ